MRLDRRSDWQQAERGGALEQTGESLPRVGGMAVSPGCVPIRPQAAIPFRTSGGTQAWPRASRAWRVLARLLTATIAFSPQTTPKRCMSLVGRILLIAQTTAGAALVSATRIVSQPRPQINRSGRTPSSKMRPFGTGAAELPLRRPKTTGLGRDAIGSAAPVPQLITPHSHNRRNGPICHSE